jgi:glycosyltransferase involved in cell wall biosynthesis
MGAALDDPDRASAPPRLLIVVTGTEIGGAQTFVATLAAGLRDRYEVCVAANDAGGPLAERCRAHGIVFQAVPALVRDIDPRTDVAAVLALRRLFERVDPDVIHLNSSKAAALGRIAAAAGRARVVYTAHGWPFGVPGRSRHVYSVAEVVLAPLADAIVCVSRYDRALAVSHLVARPHALHVIHNGIRAPDAPPPRGPWPERPRIVCVARLKPPKDVPLLLEAMTRPGLEQWEADVFGGGPLHEQTEGLVGRLGLGARVRLLGDRGDVPERLAGYDVFALPSRSEGFPFAVLEAMTRALPIVATDVGGVAEQVVDGETGYLVPAGDADAFAAALLRLGAAGDDARRMGLRGLDRVRARFTESRMVERYDALFRSLLDSRASQRRVSRRPPRRAAFSRET